MRVLKYALMYAKAGFCVLPAKRGDKVPFLKDWGNKWSRDEKVLRKWFKKDINICMATGRESGVWVLDLDGNEGIRKFYDLCTEAGEDIPVTKTQKTGGGGFQYLFKYDDRVDRNMGGVFNKIDIRSNGGQVVLPPSVHPNGNEYEWYSESGTPVEPAPEWLIKKIVEKKQVERKEPLKPADKFADGTRNETLFKHACKFRNDGYEADEILSLISAMNDKRCDPPLDDKELNVIVGSSEKYTPTKKVLAEKTIDDLLKGPKERAEKYYQQSYHRSGLLGYKLTGEFKTLQNRMDGIQQGMFLLGAIANVGKTMFLINLARSLITANSEVMVIFVSIDDNFRKIYNRMLAIEAGMEINEAANIGQRIINNDRLTEVERSRKKEKIRDAKVKVDKLLEKFILLDENDGTSIEYIKEVVERVYAINPNIILIVDNFHKIRTSNHSENSKMKFTYLSEEMKALTNRFEICTLMTVELRKLNHDNAPSPDDLKETVDLHYDCDVAWFLHSDVERNKESERYVTMESNGFEKEYPVVDLLVSKNKTSDFKGTIELLLRPEYAEYKELDYEPPELEGFEIVKQCEIKEAAPF